MAFIKKYNNGKDKKILIQDKKDRRFIIFHSDRTYTIRKYIWLDMQDLNENSYCVSMEEVRRIKGGIVKFITDKKKRWQQVNTIENYQMIDKKNEEIRWCDYILKVLDRIN